MYGTTQPSPSATGRPTLCGRPAVAGGRLLLALLAAVSAGLLSRGLVGGGADTRQLRWGPVEKRATTGSHSAGRTSGTHHHHARGPPLPTLHSISPARLPAEGLGNVRPAVPPVVRLVGSGFDALDRAGRTDVGGGSAGARATCVFGGSLDAGPAGSPAWNAENLWHSVSIVTPLTVVSDSVATCAPPNWTSPHPVWLALPASVAVNATPDEFSNSVSVAFYRQVEVRKAET